MNKIVFLTALAISSTTFATENNTASSNLAANMILGNFTRITEPVNETPNVDKSLAIFAKSFLGNSPRLTDATNEKPDVDASRKMFVDGVLNRTNQYDFQKQAVQASSSKQAKVK